MWKCLLIVTAILLLPLAAAVAWMGNPIMMSITPSSTSTGAIVSVTISPSSLINPGIPDNTGANVREANVTVNMRDGSTYTGTPTGVCREQSPCSLQICGTTGNWGTCTVAGLNASYDVTNRHYDVTANPVVVPTQTIASITQFTSSSTFQAASGNAAVGSVVVTMNPPSPAFTGSLSITGTNSCGFHLSGTQVQAGASGCSATGGPHSNGLYDDWNIVASQTGMASKTQAEAATAVAAGASLCSQPPPSYIAAMGFTTPLLCSDFSQPTLYSGGPTTTNINSWAYIVGCNTTPSTPVWQISEQNSPGYVVDCANDVQIVNVNGSQALQLAYSNNDIQGCVAMGHPIGAQDGNCSTGLTSAMNCNSGNPPGFQSNRCTMAAHLNYYWEVTWLGDAASYQNQTNTTGGGQVQDFYNTGGGCTTNTNPCGTGPNSTIEIDGIEIHPASGGGTPSSAPQVGSCVIHLPNFQPSGQCDPGGTARNQTTNYNPDVLNWHKLGYLNTFLYPPSDGAFQHTISTSGWDNDVWQHSWQCDGCGVTANNGYPENLTGFTHYTGSGGVAPTKIYIKSIRVFSCANWQTTEDSCVRNPFPSISINGGQANNMPSGTQCGAFAGCTLTHGITYPLTAQTIPGQTYSSGYSFNTSNPGGDSNGVGGNCTNAGANFSISGNNLVIGNTLGGPTVVCIQIDDGVTGDLPYVQAWFLTVQ